MDFERFAADWVDPRLPFWRRYRVLKWVGLGFFAAAVALALAGAFGLL